MASRLTLALCCGDSWPYNIHYQPRRWTHPEFAVQGGLRIDPGSVRIQFEPHGKRLESEDDNRHGEGLCVKRVRRQRCDDCASGEPVNTSEEARDRFIAIVKDGGRTAALAVQAFLGAFDESDRTAIAAAITPLLQ
jgi:hypothetical protein